MLNVYGTPQSPPKKKFRFDSKINKGILKQIEIIEKFGAKVIGVALNINGLSKEEIPSIQSQLEKSLGIPVVVPITEGVDRIVSSIKF